MKVRVGGSDRKRKNTNHQNIHLIILISFSSYFSPFSFVTHWFIYSLLANSVWITQWHANTSWIIPSSSAHRLPSAAHLLAPPHYLPIPLTNLLINLLTNLLPHLPANHLPPSVQPRSLQLPVLLASHPLLPINLLLPTNLPPTHLLLLSVQLVALAPSKWTNLRSLIKTTELLSIYVINNNNKLFLI